MRSNVFIKSILRQPIRNLILALMIGIATFGAVLRVTEYIIVRGEIRRIEEFYRAVGFLTNPGHPMGAFNNLNFTDLAWYESIKASPYVEYVDRRRVVTGYLDNLLNANVMKCHMFQFWEIEPEGVSFGIERPNVYDGLTFYHNDAYFYGTLMYSRTASHNQINAVLMYFYVDEVILGYSEHIKAGRELRLTVPVGDNNDPQHPALEMQIGGRYLLRGAWYGDEYILISSPYEGEMRWISFTGGILPIENYYALAIRPLESGTDVYFFPADAPGLYEMLVRLEPQLFDLYRNQRMVQLIATTDMTALFAHKLSMQLRHGRLIDRADYENANPVVVIENQFAEMRGLFVGDNLRITLQEHVTGILGVLYDGNDSVWNYNTYVLDLEIVGIYAHNDRTETNTTWNLFMYIPESLLPTGFAYTPSNFSLMDTGFSFVLSGRHVGDFIAAQEEALAALGYRMHFTVHRDAELFFSAADGILLTMTFNLVLFTTLIVVILALGAFTYIILMRRNFAILRVLGNSTGKTFLQMMYPVLFYWLPAIVTGGVLAWRFVLNLSGETLADVYNFDFATLGVGAAVQPSELWLISFVGVIIGIAVMVVATGGIILARKPILRQLQGR